jgi:arylsulfatase
MEGSLRTPFIVRWPGRVPAGRVSNEIVHEVDTFTTLARIAGAKVPLDRPIDGVDQSDLFLGRSERSAREGFPVFVADRLEAVKWHDYKLTFYEAQRDWWSPPVKLGVPKIFDLLKDPTEEYGSTLTPDGWAVEPMMKLLGEFEESLRKYPPIPPGTPDPYRPPAPK